MGLTYHRLNRLHEADEYLRRAVDISKDTYVEDERELIFYLLRARSFLALPNIFRGHYAESKALLYETLEMCDQHAPHHPDKPVLINSLGLIYERSDEDQDLALKFYKQSLVERRRYAEVAPGDMVVTLNNVGMQYSRRGQYDTALEYLEEATAIRAREDRWHYHTALTQQHIGQVAIQKGDYSKAERHLNEAACVYARCTPRHDARGKVALTQAHLYVTEALRDVGQTKRYLREVCRLAEPVQHDLSDNGLMTLSSAVQHTVQLEGWAPSHTVTSLLTWMQKLLLKYDGDRYKQLSEHQSIINDMLSAVSSGDVTEDQKEALTSRVIEQCQMCTALSVNENVRVLWGDSESKGEKLRSAISFLRESPAMKNVLKLSKQQSPGEAEPGTTVGGREDARAQSLTMQQEGFPGLSPSVQAELHKRHAFTGAWLSHLDQQRQEQKQDRALTGNNQDLQEQGEVAASLQQQDYQLALRLLSLNQNVHGLESLPSEERPSRDASGLPSTQHQHHNDELDLRHLESARLSGLSESRPHQPTPRVADHVTESDQYSSCSLTNSNPPSMSISDVASSLESTESLRRQQQQEEETFAQRMVVPLQETARDQRSEGFNLNASTDPTWRSSQQGDEAEAEAGSLSSATTASLRHPQEWSPQGDASHSSYGSESDWVGLRTLELQRHMEQVANIEVSSGQGSLHTAEGTVQTAPADRDSNEEGTRQDFLRDEVPQGRVTSYVESSWPENVVFCDTLQSGLQSVRPPTVSTPSMTSRSTEHARGLSFTTAKTVTSASPLTSSTSSSSQPPLTLQSVVTCAQQLMAVMPSGDVVTTEQRRALEKLASLTDISQLGGQTWGGGQGETGRVQQALLSLLPLQDQAAKLSFLEAQHTDLAPPLPQQQRPSQTLHQSQSTTQKPSSVLSQSQAPMHHVHHYEHSGFVSLHHQPRDQTRSVYQSQSQPAKRDPAAAEDQSAAHSKLAVGTERESASRVDRGNKGGDLGEPRPQRYGAQGLITVQAFEQQAGGFSQRDRPAVSQYFQQAHGPVTQAFEQHAGGLYQCDRPAVSQYFQQARGPVTRALEEQTGGFSQRDRPGMSQQAAGFHNSPEPHGSSTQRNYPLRGTEPHFSTHPLRSTRQATEIGLPASRQQTTEPHLGGGPTEAGERTEPRGVRVVELRHGTELHLGGGPTEAGEGTEPHGVRVAVLRHGTELHGVAAPREATENDERCENPGHVCTSVHCQCSYRIFN